MNRMHMNLIWAAIVSLAASGDCLGQGFAVKNHFSLQSQAQTKQAALYPKSSWKDPAQIREDKKKKGLKNEKISHKPSGKHIAAKRFGTKPKSVKRTQEQAAKAKARAGNRVINNNKLRQIKQGGRRK